MTLVSPTFMVADIDGGRVAGDAAGERVLENVLTFAGGLVVIGLETHHLGSELGFGGVQRDEAAGQSALANDLKVLAASLLTSSSPPLILKEALKVSLAGQGDWKLDLRRGTGGQRRRMALLSKATPTAALARN